MSDAHPESSTAAVAEMRRKRPKHALITRLWHWTNVVAVFVLFMSGLNIFNAHPRLYWGKYGANYDTPWLVLDRFPGWITIPGRYSLADGRIWHFFFAWVLAVALTLFMAWSLLNGHVRRDLHVRKKEWKPAAIWDDIKAHLRFDFTHHEGKFNFLQKLAYGLVLGVLLPGMVLTGMAISPGMDAAFPWLLDIFGGRQSARSIHFLFAWGLFGFFVIHVALVLLTGPIGHLRSMTLGGDHEPANPPFAKTDTGDAT